DATGHAPETELGGFEEQLAGERPVASHELVGERESDVARPLRHGPPGMREAGAARKNEYLSASSPTPSDTSMSAAALPTEGPSSPLRAIHAGKTRPPNAPQAKRSAVVARSSPSIASATRFWAERRGSRRWRSEAPSAASLASDVTTTSGTSALATRSKRPPVAAHTAT